MTRYLMGAVGAVALAGLLACQSTPSLTAALPSTIQGQSGGFAPNGAQGHTTLDLALSFGNADLVKTWKVDIAGSSGTVKSWAGDGTNPPSTLIWDGTSDSGAVAPEGTYSAHLSVTYQKTYKPAAADSSSFVLDLTPPTGSLQFDPAEFAPDARGVFAPTRIMIDASSPVAQMDTWTLDIQDSSGAAFRSFTGRWPDNSVQWDGTSSAGGVVAPGSSYDAVATVQDEFGSTAQIRNSIVVAQIPGAPAMTQAQSTTPAALSPSAPASAQAASATESTGVQPSSSGFSPLSQTLPKTIELVVSIGNKDALQTWSLSVEQATGGPQRTWSGDGTSIPGTVSWDGKTNNGSLAADGTYTAQLSVDYGSAYQAVQVQSKPFILDVTPPIGQVTAIPSNLTPDDGGGVEPETFGLSATSKTSSVQGWTLSVLGPDNAPVASFSGLEANARVPWDGVMTGGGSVDPTKDYTLKAEVTDAYGNVGIVRTDLPGGALPEVSGTVSATAQLAGFSPTSDALPRIQTFDLSYGQGTAVSEWTLQIAQLGENPVRTLQGDSSNVPASLTWDGKADDGTAAPEGMYTATLHVRYGSTYRSATAESAAFALDVNPPVASIQLSDSLFSPTEATGTITLKVDATSPVARIQGWSLDIYDPDGSVFSTFSGTWPTDQVTWDGKGSTGEMVQSAQDYPVVAKIRDEFGNVAEAKATVPVDILIQKLTTGYRILASRIYFQSFTANYIDVGSDLATQNQKRLDVLATELRKFPEYKIRVVGHAVMIYWWDPPMGEVEQREVLIPLSQARADAIKGALVDRGINAAIFTTDGEGAMNPLVPNSDLKNRWQNRRVALFLNK